MINTLTGKGSAIAIPQKGAGHLFVSKWAAKVLTRSSGAKFCLQTDPEPSIKVLARAVSGMAEKPTTTREPPVGGHESNDSIERYSRTLHVQIRTVRFCIGVCSRHRAGRRFSIDDMGDSPCVVAAGEVPDMAWSHAIQRRDMHRLRWIHLLVRRKSFGAKAKCP